MISFENGPMIMQRVMAKISLEMIGKNMMVYMNDIVVFNKIRTNT